MAASWKDRALRAELRVRSLRRDASDLPRDFVAERRSEQAHRAKQIEFLVGDWFRVGKWRTSAVRCKCGRAHHAIEMRVDDNVELLCPVTTWAKLAFYHKGEFETPMEKFVRRFNE